MRLAVDRGVGSARTPQYALFRRAVGVVRASAGTETEAAAKEPVDGPEGPLFCKATVATIVLIAGTTIGGGTLALPAAAAPAGFIPASCMLVGCWLFLFVEAVLLVEVSVRMKAEGSVRPGEVVSFEAMAERTMGKLGGGVTGLIYQFYSYASILAYVAASGDVVRLLTQGALSSPQGQVVTVFGIFGLIVLAGSKGIQSINEKLNYVFFLLLATIIGVGMLQVSPAAVVSNTNWGAAPGAAGILLFNVVFHDIIPLICEELDYNLRKINVALFVGSAVPMVCYVLWLVVSLGGVGSGGEFVDPVKQVMQGSGVASKVVQLWALLAVITSFIGCGMAQAEYESSLMRQWMAPVWGKLADGGGKIKAAWDNGGLDMLSYAVVLLPPLVVSLLLPDLFFKAADLAGVYGVAVLYGVLPPVMVGLLRRQQSNKLGTEVSSQSDCTPGGAVTLAALFAIGMAIAVRETLTYF